MPSKLSFYELSLRSYLKDSHPTLLNNNDFIEARSSAAAAAYATAFEDGHDSQQCRAIANETLFSGLLFSYYKTLITVLREEFSIDDVSKLHSLALGLQIELNYLFTQFKLEDDFQARPEYQTLYTEITGAVKEKLDSNGL